MSIYRNRYVYCRRREYGYMWPILVISLFIILLSFRASAKTIWRIGEDDGSANVFGLPGSIGSDPAINQEVVQFLLPQDTNAYDWKSFPSRIWPPEASFNPKEIHIKYSYPGDLRCPVLRIKARSAVRNFTQGLIVTKGNGDILSQDLRLPSFYPDPDKTPEIPVGIIWKGLHEENTLIIKNISLTADNHSIFIDYLELLEPDDQDLDGDGSFDYEEIEGDIDEDGIENSADPDTVTIFIQAKDFTKSKQITLDLQEKNEQGPLFTYLIPFFTDSPDIIQGPPEGFFFPYGLFRAYLDIPVETDTLMLSLYTSENQIIYDNAQFYLYDENAWRVIPVEILSRNALRISILTGINQKNKEGDYTGEFILTGGLAYPEELDIDLENVGLCLIKSVWD
ncbi:MAG: hypothetical protein ACMUIU_12910 [bacterium]